MRHYDKEEAARLNAEQWMLDLLALNPGYVGWGPHEDYMITEGSGWHTSRVIPTWAEFGPPELDDFNECVNFYFSVNRESKDCATCGGNGYHPDAQHVVNTFYAHMNAKGEHWNDKITQDECDALITAGRIKKKGVTAEEVNAANRRGSRMLADLSHDGINRSILVRQRLKRLGLPHDCPTCEGHGYVYTEGKPHVSLTLWWLHPRKGCSRGIEITRIQREELPEIFGHLRFAADRNAERFSRVPCHFAGAVGKVEEAA